MAKIDNDNYICDKCNKEFTDGGYTDLHIDDDVNDLCRDCMRKEINNDKRTN